MTDTAKPTEGPWEYRPDSGYIYAALGEYEICEITCPSIENEGEVDANGRLIAEAGTVYHETGLTPQQLLARVRELEEQARRTIKFLDSIQSHECINLRYAQAKRLANDIEEALAKH